jgi:hypothetical protein
MGLFTSPLLKEHYFKKQIMSVQLDPEPQGIIDYFALA